MGRSPEKVAARSDEDRAARQARIASREEPQDKCPHCDLDKDLIESRLHARPKKQRYGWTIGSTSSHSLAIGSAEGCPFCELLSDACATWKRDRSQTDIVLSDLRFYLKRWSTDEHCSLSLRSQAAWVSMSIFRTRGHESPWNLEEPSISEDLSTPGAIITARQWLESCKNDHVLCKLSRNIEEAPKRLLRLDSDQITLCESRNLDISSYACLSHCWGPLGPTLQLRADTVAALMAGIPIAELPKTFRDAACFCWRLGICYLWIDALCIFQDSEQDWNEAAVTMAAIYEGALVTLAATWSKSSNSGCFPPPIVRAEMSEPGLCVREKLEDFPSGVIWSEGEDWPLLPRVEDWPLLTRAWVYQERRLSPRVIHFGKQQLFWECCSSQTSESGSHMSNKEKSWDSLMLQGLDYNPERAWRSTVENYSRLRLSHEKDRLPAISALVKKMQQFRQTDVYIAGVWMDSLIGDLLWRPVKREPGPRPDRPGIIAPSWSWISVSSGVVYDQYEHRLPLPLSVVETAYSITGAAHIGQVSRASIVLEGRFVYLRLSLRDSGSAVLRISERDDFQGKNLWAWEIYDKGWDFDHTTATPPLHESDTFKLLLLSKYGKSTYFGIVLRELGSKHYERVGYATFRHQSNQNLLRQLLSEDKPPDDIETITYKGKFTIV